MQEGKNKPQARSPEPKALILCLDKWAFRSTERPHPRTVMEQLPAFAWLPLRSYGFLGFAGTNMQQSPKEHFDYWQQLAAADQTLSPRPLQQL